MRILFISSEVAPFSKTGGLGDVAGALPRALARRGHDVRVVTPLYESVKRDGLKPFGEPVRLTFPFGAVEVRSQRHESEVETVFVEQQSAFGRKGIYGHDDDSRRFTVLSLAALAFEQRDGFRPDVVQGNDWQTGPALLALRLGYGATTLGRPKRVMTIHNLAYQGTFAKSEMDALGIPWSMFNVDGVEFFDHLSFMKAGLTSADLITTVSPSYAREIQTPAFGNGLDGLLRSRTSRLHGILNGVDTREWNPATDVLLPETFTAADPGPRLKCRDELLAQMGVTAPAPGLPLFGVISRMTGQKGVDLLHAVLPRVLERGASAVVLGSGEPAIEAQWRAMERRFPNRLSVRIGFDESLAHRIEAGTDFFLMPSRFEPCGLNQMYSLLYGSVPVVHAVGGLKDTVIDASQPHGNGIVFNRPTPESFFEAMVRAVELFRDRERYRAVQKAGMVLDFGWEHAAAAYETLFAMNS